MALLGCRSREETVNKGGRGVCGKKLRQTGFEISSGFSLGHLATCSHPQDSLYDAKQNITKQNKTKHDQKAQNLSQADQAVWILLCCGFQFLGRLLMPIDPGFGAFGRRSGLQPLTTPENWNNCLKEPGPFKVPVKL